MGFRVLIVSGVLGLMGLSSGAMISVERVSPERARQLGVSVSTNSNGQAGIRVTLQYPKVGELEKVTYVEAVVGAGTHSEFSAHLRETEPTAGRGSASFSVAPVHLHTSRFMIVVYHGPRGDVGYEVRVRDFLGVPSDVVQGPTAWDAARALVPRDVSDQELGKALEAGLWNSDRTALGVALPRSGATRFVVVLHRPEGGWLATDASGVEGGNLGKLGTGGRSVYERIETTPIRWLPRDDGLYQVVVRTRVWKSGKRFTVSEPLVIRADGTVLYR